MMINPEFQRLVDEEHRELLREVEEYRAKLKLVAQGHRKMLQDVFERALFPITEKGTPMDPNAMPTGLDHFNAAITRAKTYRLNLDLMLQEMKADPAPSRELSLAITKIQEAIMWCGMQLKELNGGRTIYAESYNPANTIVEPTADGIKL